MDDAQLIARARQGDELAFAELVQRHSETVWRLAFLILGNHCDAEDAVSDTFLKAYRGLANFRGEAAARTWLVAICRNVCRDRMRAIRPALVPLDCVSEWPAPESASCEERLDLLRAWKELSDDERLALEYVIVAGYSRQEAAQVLGIPASTMRSRVTLALRHLGVALAIPHKEVE